ncbi:MAG: response regulator [Methylococcaceae bacterium]|nr:response regulator [Methylococcaceae bacterium]
MTNKASILIVDDLPKNLKLLAELMREHDYLVRPVTSGKLALLASEEIPPDLILLDINMPDMDGFETCQRLKACDKTKHIPVIFLSANNEVSDIVRGFEVGAIDYITKPFNVTEVLIRVKTQLELKFSKEIIEQKNREQQELLHILCHDLMNSVGAVQGFLSLKKEEGGTLEYDELISLSTNNAIDVIDSVRQIKSIEEGKVNIELTLLNLMELIEMSSSILNEKIREKNIELVIDVDKELKIAVERISFINSVLNNLLTNAIKFSFPNSKIIISAKQTEKEVKLSIKDFGIGMSEKLCNDIFNVGKITTRKGTNGESGTGFGMPLVKKFIEAYGGEIEVFSQEKTNTNTNHGTEINLYITTDK